MIQKLRINNFKSIKDLNLECKKLNVFIGEPNSGKSNIIEALSLQSQNIIQQDLNKNIFRYKTISDLFYDFNINNPIEIITDHLHTKLQYGTRTDGIIENQFNYYMNFVDDKVKSTVISHEGKIMNIGESGKTNVRFYEFKMLTSFIRSHMSHLSVPHGENLPELLLSNSEYKKWVSEFLTSSDLKLTLRPVENEIVVSKLIDDEIYSYPYFSLSETLQRIIFYTMCIKTNKESVILLDEPDSNTFPFYTKNLAEQIASDETNQFFITTHNPYLLLSLIEKSKEEEINICISQMKDFVTILSVLNSNQISQVLDLNTDVFFNFEKLLT
jgi:AAA15 family ATPase/GTPase